MKKSVLVFLSVLIIIVCIYVIKVNKDNSFDINQNLKLIYETTVSPNENFVTKEEDKVFYTIKVFQNNNDIKIVLNSNSEFSEDFSYEINCDKEITKNDINVEWQTLMGGTDFTEENQIAVAVITISSNGEVISQRKVNFISRAIDIVVDTINNN